MQQTLIFWPMIAQVVLVLVIYALISKRRFEAIAAGNAKPSQFRENVVEPDESRFVRNNLANQFELPVLFYAGCISLFVTGGVTLLTLSLAWIFVISRFVHAWIHVTTNRIRHRRPLFIVGFLAAALMWGIFAVQLATR